MQTQNIYRIIRVDHLTARVVNLFTGQARILPKSHLHRLYISDLTNLRYFCTNRYLQNMQHKLYKQNKLTSSDQSKTWLQLLRKPSQTHIDIPYSDEEISKDEEADIEEELGRVNTAEDLTPGKPEESANNLDAINKDDDPFLGFQPTQQGRKFTRSGKAYNTSAFPKKILKKTKPAASFSQCLKSITLHQAIACRKAEKLNNELQGVANRCTRFHSINFETLKTQQYKI